MIEEFIGRVFALRNEAHLAHWLTPSRSDHMALGQFYAALIDGVDRIVEVYQGAFGRIGTVEVAAARSGSIEIVDLISREAQWIADNREEIARGDAALLALIDDFVAHYLSAAYQLINLK